MNRLVLPSSSGEVPIKIIPHVEGFRASCLGVSVTAKTEKTAALRLARKCFENRQVFGLVGQARLKAMTDAQERLQALIATPSQAPDSLLSWRLRARVLGCHVPESKGPENWVEELAARKEIVSLYVARSAAAGPIGVPGRRYRVIVADPPWSFQDKGTRLAPEYEGKQRKEAAYQTLPLPEILALGESVRACSAEDALLFLWVPASLAAQAYHTRVAKAWGFECKTEVPWIKTAKNGAPRMGAGHYTRLVHEPLWICSKGRGASLIQNHGTPGVIFAPRGAHSEKPQAGYDMIDKLAGDVYKLELFARKTREGYDAWGDEIQ